MTIGRAIPRYGRIEVGQRVLFERLVPAPTTERPSSQWGRGGSLVTLRTEHLVDEIRLCDSGALVTLRHADGRGEIRACFNAYGQSWGGFGGLVVLHDAPLQPRPQPADQPRLEPVTAQADLFELLLTRDAMA